MVAYAASTQPASQHKQQPQQYKRLAAIIFFLADLKKTTQ